MIRFFLCAVLMLCTCLVWAQKSYYWVPVSGNLASNIANWRQGSCNGPSGILPGANDTAVFTKCSGTSYSCTVDISFQVKQWELKSNYTGTVSMNPGITLQFKTGKFNGGNFMGSSGTISSTKTMTIDGASFTAPSGELSIKGTFNYKSGFFLHNNGTVIIRKGSGASSKLEGVSGNPLTILFNDLEFSPSGTSTIYHINHVKPEVTGRLLISGNKAMSLATTSYVTLKVSGQFELNNALATLGTLRFLFTGNGEQSISGSASPTFHQAEISKTGGFVRLFKGISVSSELHLNSGYLVCDSANAVHILHGASVLQASEQSFIRGAVKKTGNAAFTFPIGAGLKYRPLEISAPSSVSDVFMAYYHHGEQEFGSVREPVLTYISQCEYWALRQMNGSAAVTVQLPWDLLTCDIDTLPTLRIARWDSAAGSWKTTGAAATTGTVEVGTIVTSAAQTAFGNFLIAKSAPLFSVDAGTDIAACSKTRISLGGNPTAIGGTPPYRYSWSPALHMDSTYFSNPIVTAVENITYVVTVTDADDVTASDTIEVQLREAPVAQAGFDRFVSLNGAVTLGGITEGGTPPYTYQWSPALHLDQDDVEQPLCTPMGNMTYRLTVSDSEGCLANDMVYVNLTMPSLGKAGMFGLLGRDSVISNTPVLVDALAGAGKYVSGTVHSNDSIVINATLDSLAQMDLEAALATLKAVNGISINAALGGQLLVSGIYQVTSKATLSGTLTLAGDPNSIFIINLKDSLVVSDGASILLDGIHRSQVLIRVNKGMRVSGSASLPATFLVEKDIRGGFIENATLLSNRSILIDGGSFIPAVLEARTSAISRNDAADWFGVNTSNVERVSGIYQTNWSNTELRKNLPVLNARVFRFPPGGDSKFWNTNDGWFLNPDEKTDSTSISYSPRLQCVNPSFTFNEEAVNLPVDRLLEFQHILGGNDGKAMLTINLFTNREFQENILYHALDLGMPLAYAELGNEFYLRGQTCGFLDAPEYATEVNAYLDLIHNTPALSGINVGVVASAFSSEDDLTNETGCRRITWNAELLPLLNGLQPGDALTFHLYPETGIANNKAPDVTLDDMPTLFKKAYREIDEFAATGLAALNDYPGIDAWITEYNLTAPTFKIHGSWAQGLFLSLFTLRLLEFEKVKLVTCQTMANDAARGLLFTDQYGYFIPDEWVTIDSTLLTQTWALTNSGLAVKMITEAMRYSSRATLLQFPHGPVLENSDYPAIYGWTFDKADLGDKQSVLINLSGERQAVNIGRLQPASAYEQVYCTNPLYFITGYVYRDEPSPGIYNAVEHNYASLENVPVNYDSLNVKIPAGASVIHLPPYSITRLYVLNSNSVWVRQSGNSVCAPDPDGTVPGQSSTAVNLFASGGASYEWSLAETGSRQQCSASANPASPVSGGQLKVLDPEGNVIGIKNDISISSLSLPNVQVSPSSFDNGLAPTFSATASGADFYNWNPSLGLSSISGNNVTIRPAYSGTYYVIGTAGNHCSKVKPIEVRMAPEVSIKAFGGYLNSNIYPPMLTVCNGNIITLMADGAADSYHWTSADGLVDATTPSVSFQPDESTLVTLVATDHVQNTSSKTSLWIRSFPTVLVEQADLFGCSNEFIKINGDLKDGGPNTQFCWDDQEGGTLLYEKKNLNKPITENACSTLYDPVFFYGPEGEYLITLKAQDTDFIACPGVQNDYDLKLHIRNGMAPAVSPSLCMINGGTIALSASGSATNFTWSGPNLLQSIGASVEAAPTETATYTVTSSNQQCCQSATVQVTVEPVVAACDDSRYCYGCNSKIISVIPFEPLEYQYQWFEDGQLISGATGGSYEMTIPAQQNFKEATVYCAVSKTDQSCVPGRTNEVRVSLSKTCHYAREEESATTPGRAFLSLHPNPASDQFRVSFHESTGYSGPVWVSVFDSYGKRLWHETADCYHGKFDLEIRNSFPGGMYLVRVCTGTDCLSERLMVTR